MSHEHNNETLETDMDITTKATPWNKTDRVVTAEHGLLGKEHLARRNNSIALNFERGEEVTSFPHDRTTHIALFSIKHGAITDVGNDRRSMNVTHGNRSSSQAKDSPLRALPNIESIRSGLTSTTAYVQNTSLETEENRENSSGRSIIIISDHTRNNSFNTTCNLFDLDAPGLSPSTCSFLDQTSWFSGAIFLPTLIFGGTVGNLISFTVMLRPNMRRYSTSLYAAALSVVDTIYLWGIFPQAYFTWTGDEGLHNVLSGKLLYFVYHTCCYGSAWLTVAISIDRFLLVFYPMKAARYCTLARTRIVISIICITIPASCTYLIIYIDHNFVAEYGVLPIFNNPDAHYYFYEVIPIVDMCMYVSVPFIILVCTNSLLMKKIVHMRKLDTHKTVGNTRSNASNDSISSKVQIQLTITSVLVCTVLIICTLPLLVTSTLVSKCLDRFSNEGKVWILFAASLTGVLPYVNSSVNCILYGMTGEKFRKEFIMLWPCHFYKGIQRNKNVAKGGDASPYETGSVETVAQYTIDTYM